MWGTITGAISGAVGAGFSEMGTELVNHGVISQFNNILLQGGVNGAVSASLTALKGQVTNSFSLNDFKLSFAFGFAGGVVGITRFGDGWRGVITNIGLGFGETFYYKIVKVLEYISKHLRPQN